MRSLSMRLTTLLLAAATLLAGAGTAGAHALLRHAQPPVGATVKAAPADLLLIFTEGVEPAFSSVAVTGPGGARVDTGTVRTDPKDATHLLVALQPLAPGTYTVIWHVTSVDTHKTDGSYQFTVRP
jgi:hypothetical protein